LVYRVDLSTGQRNMILADYNASPSQPGDSPVGLVNIDSNQIYVVVENTTTAGARRIEKVSKSAFGTRSLFSNTTAALSAQLRGVEGLSNGDLLITKSTAIEKITSSNVRIVKGTSPFVNAPAAPCATSTTLISKTLTLNNGHIVYLHAATSQNRIGVINASGYSTAGDCLASKAAPIATAFPVAMTYDRINSNLIVAYSGNSTAVDVNSIYVYPVTETASSVTIGTGAKIYDSNLYPSTYNFLLYGVSDMVLDSTDNSLYVATAVNTSTTILNFAIEKLRYHPNSIGVDNTSVLTKSASTSFYNFGADTKCISDMMIAD